MPVVGANVTFDDHSLGMVTTDDAGRFVRLLSAGKHWVYINAAGYESSVQVSALCVLYLESLVLSSYIRAIR